MRLITAFLVVLPATFQLVAQAKTFEIKNRGESKPVTESRQKRFSNYFLKDFDFYNGFGTEAAGEPTQQQTLPADSERKSSTLVPARHYSKNELD